MSEGPRGEKQPANVDRIGAEAIGEPGQRRFRLLAVIGSETYIVWLEKEQLRRLAQALDQVLDNLPDSDDEPTEPPLVPEFDIGTRHQVRAGRMELGYDERLDRLIVIAYDIEAEDGAEPSFACRLTRAQADELVDIAETVISAGRPLCPLCGAPIGPGPHTCAKQNGHFPHRDAEMAAEDYGEPEG